MLISHSSFFLHSLSCTFATSAAETFSRAATDSAAVLYLASRKAYLIMCKRQHSYVYISILPEHREFEDGQDGSHSQQWRQTWLEQHL